MSLRTDNVLGVVAVNSPLYVDTVLNALRDGRVFVPLRSSDDEQRLRAANVSQVVAPAAGSGWLTPAPATRHDDELASYMFTSGTEGEPKKVALTHLALADVVQRLNEVMQLDGSVREYIGVPVYHSFGFGRCRAIAAVGGRAYLPNAFNPLELTALLRSGEINAISAVPSLWRVLLAAGCVTPELARRVRWIEIGSQYMSRSEKEQLRGLFASAVIVQHYGLTEASCSTFLEIHRASGEQLESVGRATGSVELRISEAGRVAIRGPHVTREVTIGDTVTDPRDGQGWYETNDLGELRDGHLFYLGRADDVINCSGLKLSPETLEARVEERLRLGGAFAICRIADPLRGDGILLAAQDSVTVGDDELAEAVAVAAQGLGVNARGAIRVQRLPSLPRTASGKVQRRLIGQQFSQADVPRSAPAGDPAASATHPLRAAFVKHLGVRSIAGSDTFIGLGGDSLAFIQTSIAVEQRLGYVPENWEQRTLDELESLPVKNTGSASLEPMIWLRAAAICAIVANHSGMLGQHIIPGGAFLLLVLSGMSFARFQLQRALLEQRPWPVLSGLPKLLVPVLLLLGLQQLRHRDFSATQLTLTSNFVGPEEGGYWFIEVWVQIYLALFLVLAVPPVARAVKQHALASAVVALVCGVAARSLVPQLWSAEFLWNRVPHMSFWLFAFGWTAVVAGSGKRWPLTAFILLAGPLLGIGLGPQVWITVGSLLLLWMPPLRVPPWLAAGISWISAASLYIYIMQYHCFTVASRLLPQAPGLAGWVLAIVGGGLLRVAADIVWRKAGHVLRGVPALNRGPSTSVP